MSRKRLRSAVSARGFSRRLLIVAALVAVLVGIARVSGGASSSQAGVVSHPSAGIARSGSTASGGGSGIVTASATSFGPNVGNGIYDGESPAVSDLPVLPGPAPTSIIARDNENLHPSAFASTAKDPVVQKKKGTGAISDPIANFDGICLPFGPPCDQASSCGCLPPDTDGEVGGDPVRPDRQQRLRRLLEVRLGPARRDADQPALGRYRQRVRGPQRRRPGRRLRPAPETGARLGGHRAARPGRAGRRDQRALGRTRAGR